MQDINEVRVVATPLKSPSAVPGATSYKCKKCDTPVFLATQWQMKVKEAERLQMSIGVYCSNCADPKTGQFKGGK